MMAVHAAWQQLREGDTEAYSDETLSRATLNDDYQQLFVTMLLDHVQHLLECIKEKRQPEPLRLLLLGTAGSGKTRAVQTALQEIQRGPARVRARRSTDWHGCFQPSVPGHNGAPNDPLVHAPVLQNDQRR